MIYTELTKKAMEIAFKAHGGVLGKDGLPYIMHPLHVAEGVETEEETIAALLHDVVEDSDYTLEDLRAEGFPETVLEALRLLTHDDGTPYMDYVAKAGKNELARKVKMLDLLHNMDLARMDTVTEEDVLRAEKYEQAFALLLDGDNDWESRELTAEEERMLRQLLSLIKKRVAWETLLTMQESRNIKEAEDRIRAKLH